MTYWERDFLNLNVDEKVCIFDKIILNINFIPHETLIFDDRDPPWFNNFFKEYRGNKKFLNSVEN